MQTVYHPTNWLLKMPGKPLFHRTREGCAQAHGVPVEEVTETLYNGPESAIAPEPVPEAPSEPVPETVPEPSLEQLAEGAAQVAAAIPAPEAVPASEPAKSPAKKSKKA